MPAGFFRLSTCAHSTSAAPELSMHVSIDCEEKVGQIWCSTWEGRNTCLQLDHAQGPGCEHLQQLRLRISLERGSGGTLRDDGGDSKFLYDVTGCG